MRLTVKRKDGIYRPTPEIIENLRELLENSVDKWQVIDVFNDIIQKLGKYEDEDEDKYPDLLLKSLNLCCCNEHHYEFSKEQKDDELIIKDEWGKEIVRKKIK